MSKVSFCVQWATASLLPMAIVTILVVIIIIVIVGGRHNDDIRGNRGGSPVRLLFHRCEGGRPTTMMMRHGGWISQAGL